MKHFRYLEDTVTLQLDDSRCIGCGNCVVVCPHRVFTLAGKKAQIADLGGCMECQACSRNCPTEAISLAQGEGCGCATLLLTIWLYRLIGKTPATGGCC